MNCVELENVTKQYGSHKAVNTLDLAVPEGSVCGFIGPNGSGKTTTIRMILHIIQPDTGSVSVLGESGIRAANDSIGYLPEERGMYKKMPLKRQITYFGSLKGMTRSAAAKVADDWLEKLDLTKWANHKIEALSKGMAQKAQFISAVVASPKLLILDEPFSGLDPVNLEVLRSAILEMREQGTTIIFSTHDMSMAEKMCDSIFMIYQGNKVLDGTLDNIQSKYGTDTIRLLTESQTDIGPLPGVVNSVRDGRYQLLNLAPDADTRQILSQIIAKDNIKHFEIAKPSLHDIFIRIAGPEAKEANHE